LSDEDMVRLWLLANGPLFEERARSIGEATALAAVAVIERNQRPLARKRRRRQANRLRFEQTPEERYAEIFRIEDGPSFDEKWRCRSEVRTGSASG
jgi:hypothetical protein